MNNVETFSHVPHIVKRGADWFRSLGTEKSPGTTIFGVSGHVNRPGLYELPLGTPLSEIIFEHAKGLPDGRRVITGVPYIAAVMLIYPFIAPYLPGALGAPPVSIQRVVDHMFFTTEGIFGIPIGVSATFVFLFVLFGAFLERTGLGQLFVDIAMALAGWMTGGPAKVSVLSSAFIGTVSGSSVANGK